MTGRKAWLAELIGTFAFVTIGAGAVLRSGAGPVGLIRVSLAHGLALSIMVTVFAGISGGHFNPAVTLSVLLARRMKTSDAIGYWVAQLAGAVAAAMLLAALLPDAGVERAVPAFATTGDMNAMRAVVLEAVFTFFLLLAVWGTGVDERGAKVGGFGIGFTVSASILVIGPLTGAALNPARYFGPALLAADLSQIWVYFVGPALGGVAGVVYPALYLKRQERPVTT